MGSFSDWWSSATTATPSAAPAPTTFYNDYSDPDNPVLDTMSAVADRRRGDGSTSSEYALAKDENFTPAAAVVEKSFGDAFAENRAAGKETFTFDGNLYTTEVAERLDDGLFSNFDILPSTSTSGLTEVELPNGRSYYADESGTFIGLVPENVALDTPTEDDLMSQEVVGAAAQEYADSLPAFSYDFTADDTSSEDDLMSQEVVDTASQEYLDSLPDFSYDFTADDTSSVTSGGRDLDADLGVGGSSATVSAADLAAFNADPFGGDYGEGIIEGGNIAAIPLDGGGGLLVNDSSDIYDKINADAAAAVDSRGAFEIAKDVLFDDRNVIDRKVSDAASNLLNASGAVNPYGSPLPDSSQVAGGDWEEYFKNASTQDILNTAGSNVTIPVTPDATPSYDAFGNEYATAEQAAQADIDANNAAVMANNPDFEAQFPGDVPEGMISSSADIAPEQGLSGSDLLKYTAIGLPDNVGNMFSGMGNNLNLTAPLNTLQGFNQQNVGLMSVPIALTNRILESFMSPEEKQRRILAADPNRQGSSISQGLTTAGDYLSNTVSPYISDFLNPGSQQGVFEGDFGDKVSVTGVDGTNLTGTTAVQGIADTVAAEGIADAAVDVGLSATPVTRGLSAFLNAGEQLTGFESDVSTQVDQAYVDGLLDDNQVYKDALAAQNGDVDNALAAVKNLVYSDGYGKIAASGAVQGLVPGMKPGIVGVAKEGLKQGGVEMGQGAYEGYQAISSINNVLGTDFDPTKNIVGNALTEGVAGPGAVVVAGGANALSARQRRDALDEAAVMSQPVVAPYGGMDTSGITPGFKQGRSPGSAGSPGTIEGQFTVYDPNLSPTAGEPASSTVSTAYDLEGPEAGLALTDQRDPMTTSMETMAAQEVINDQVNQTGTVDVGILQRIQKATGLSMNELGSMVESATSTQLTPDQIAAIESAPTGEIMTNAPVAPGFDDEVTGNFGGSNISVRPNPDGTTTLTAPSGRISVVEPGQDLDQAIKVFDEIVTPIDVQTDAPVLQSSGQGLAAPDFTAAPFASTNIGGLSSLGLPSGADLTPAVDTSSGRDVITNKMDADNTFAEVSDAQAVANAEAIKAQEVAYTETKAATGSDSAAEAAGESAYDASIAASSVTGTDDGGAEVEIADNLFEAANKADQDVVTVNADGTATVAVDPNAVETGTDVAVVPETTTDVTTNADGTTDVVVDGTTDLTTAATTDLTVDGDTDTDTDTDTTAVTVVDNTIDGTATEISGAITDQTTDDDTGPKVVVVPDTKVLTEVEPPEDEEVEVEVEEEEEDPGEDVTVDLDEDDTFVPVITSTDENGETITECPEGYTMVEGPDGPMCQKSVTTTVRRQRAGASTRAYTGLSGNRGRVGPGQRSRSNTTTTTETVDPTTRSA